MGQGERRDRLYLRDLGGATALETTYGNVKLSVPANIAKAHPNRPVVVASKDTLVLDRDEYVVAPAALVAWALSS